MKEQISWQGTYKEKIDYKYQVLRSETYWLIMSWIFVNYYSKRVLCFEKFQLRMLVFNFKYVSNGADILPMVINSKVCGNRI